LWGDDVLTLAEFRLDYPAFADLTAFPDAFVDRALQRAGRRVSEDGFGELLNDAHGLLTAHLLEYLSIQRGGGAQSVTAGSVSVTFPAAFGVRGLEMTSYGKEFIELVNLMGPAMFAATDLVSL
jgi:hypothetical protein